MKILDTHYLGRLGGVNLKNDQFRKKLSGQKSVKGNPGGRGETTGVVFVKQVGFKPGVKERKTYG